MLSSDKKEVFAYYRLFYSRFKWYHKIAENRFCTQFFSSFTSTFSFAWVCVMCEKCFSYIFVFPLNSPRHRPRYVRWRSFYITMIWVLGKHNAYKTYLAESLTRKASYRKFVTRTKWANMIVPARIKLSKSSVFSLLNDNHICILYMLHEPLKMFPARYRYKWRTFNFIIIKWFG